MGGETMTTAEVRELLCLGSNRAARTQLTTRWGIAAVGRDVATGQKLWPADQVRARAATHRSRPRSEGD